jgi:hypothetical protein
MSFVMSVTGLLMSESMSRVQVPRISLCIIVSFTGLLIFGRVAANLVVNPTDICMSRIAVASDVSKVSASVACVFDFCVSGLCTPSVSLLWVCLSGVDRRWRFMTWFNRCRRRRRIRLLFGLLR